MTPDPNERASELEELARQSAMVTSKKAEGPVATGECLYCHERLPKPMRWCNADCRNDYQIEQQRLSRK